MAGLAKPNISGLGNKVNATIISHSISYGSVYGLFDGICTDEWNTSRVCYWYPGSGNYIELSIPKTCNIYRCGSAADTAHYHPLKIKKYVDGNYIDIEDTHTLPTTYIPCTKWEKFIKNLPAGRYRFCENGASRIDSEWYIESIHRFLIKKNNQYFSINKEYYDTNLQAYLPLENIDFEKGFDLNSFFTELKIESESTSVTPVMTSDNTPAPYVITSSGSYSDSYPPYKAFTGTTIDSADCWATIAGTTTGWIMIDMSTPTTINMLRLTARNCNDPQSFPKTLVLYGSNDGNEFSELETITDLVALPIPEQNVITLPTTYNFRFYKIEIIENHNYGYYSSIGNIDFSYSPPPLATFLPIDKFDNFQLVYIENTSVKINGLKSNKELIVASDDIITSIASNIEYFKLKLNQIGNGAIKIAISINKGLTWSTYSGGVLSPLDITIPLKQYSLLSTEENKQWHNAAELIAEQGISTEIFNKIDFNTLAAPLNSIRLAYAISRPAYSDVAESDTLSWKFDAKGSLKKMKDSEYDADIYEHQLKFTSLIENPFIKVNILV